MSRISDNPEMKGFLQAVRELQTTVGEMGQACVIAVEALIRIVDEDNPKTARETAMTALERLSHE